MSILYNGVNVKKIIYGGKEVKATYYGGKKIFSNLPVKGPYLSFIEENNKPFTLKVSSASKNWDGALYYSTDTQSWSEWDGKTINSSTDGRLYLRGTGNTRFTYGKASNRFELTENKRIQCLGNIENLLDYKTVASGNHPAMAASCYFYLFYNCTSLTKAPELPATTLTVACYSSMFGGCTSLTQAPELPATTLTTDCYDYMFYGCTALTKAPKLPATTLKDNCYMSMFDGCKSLTQAPKLPATKLAEFCYYTMFNGCTSLTGAIHCPKSTASDTNRLTTNDIAGSKATIAFDL